MSSLDPYAELDLPRDADIAAVKRAYRKRAYRKRAKTRHPDAGGTAEDFDRLTRSMLVLTNPERRKKYDSTGDIDDAAPDNSVAHAVSIVVGFFSAAVAQSIQASRDPCTLDLIGLARKNFKEQIVAFENQKVPINKAAAAMERVEKRLRSRKTANPICRRRKYTRVQFLYCGPVGFD